MQREPAALVLIATLRTVISRAKAMPDGTPTPELVQTVIMIQLKTIIEFFDMIILEKHEVREIISVLEEIHPRTCLNKKILDDIEVLVRKLKAEFAIP